MGIRRHTSQARPASSRCSLRNRFRRVIKSPSASKEAPVLPELFCLALLVGYTSPHGFSASTTQRAKVGSCPCAKDRSGDRHGQARSSSSGERTVWGGH